MIESKIQIEDGAIQDMHTDFGFIYLDADERTAPDEKDDAVTSYADEPGEHRDGRTVYAPFDYSVTFLVEAPNRDLSNVNSRIAAFNDAIRETEPGSGIHRKREITFFNLHNRVKIVGYPDLIAVPKTVYHSKRYGELEFAEVELKIRVSHPEKCEFDLLLGENLSGGNLLYNSAFNGTDGWEVYSNWGSASIDTEVTFEGRNSVKVVNTDGGRHYMGLGQWLSLSPGEYTAVYWAKRLDSIDWIAAEIRGFDADGNRTDTISLGGINNDFTLGEWWKKITHFTITQDMIDNATGGMRLDFYNRSVGTAYFSSPAIFKGNIDNPLWEPSIRDTTIPAITEAQSQPIMTLDLYEDNTSEFPLIRDSLSGYGELAGDGGKYDNLTAED